MNKENFSCDEEELSFGIGLRYNTEYCFRAIPQTSLNGVDWRRIERASFNFIAPSLELHLPSDISVTQAQLLEENLIVAHDSFSYNPSLLDDGQ